MEENLKPAPTNWDAYVAGVVSWLTERWGPEKPCPYCGDTGWTIGAVRRVPTAPNWPLEPGEVEPGFIPAIPITSTQCGHVVFINALWIFEPQDLRLLEEERQEAEQEQA